MQFNIFGWLYTILAAEIVALILLNLAGRSQTADHYFYIAIYAVAAVYAIRRGARLAAVTAISVALLRMLVALGNDGLPLQVASLLFANLFVLLIVIYSHDISIERDRRLGTNDREENPRGEGQDEAEEGRGGDSGG